MDIDQIISQEIKDFQRALVAKDEVRSRALDNYVRPRIVVRESVLPMGSLPVPPREERKLEQKPDTNPIPTYCAGFCNKQATLTVAGITACPTQVAPPDEDYILTFVGRSFNPILGDTLCLWTLDDGTFTYGLGYDENTQLWSCTITITTSGGLVYNSGSQATLGTWANTFVLGDCGVSASGYDGTVTPTF